MANVTSAAKLMAYPKLKTGGTTLDLHAARICPPPGMRHLASKPYES